MADHPKHTSTERTTRYVLLLRGINVGGHRLPMAELRKVLQSAGCSDVTTYIQSGNAVVTAPDTDPSVNAKAWSQAISDYTGYSVPVVVRTEPELAQVVTSSPFPHADPRTVHVMFLSYSVESGWLTGIEGQSNPGEEHAVVGSHIYLHLPQGMSRARLPGELEKLLSRLGPPADVTTRNWNTVVKLHSLASRVL